MKNSNIEFVSFFGGRDKLVPEETGHILKKVLGKRYTHVVHEDAGHISYIFSISGWDKKHKKALNPNPIETLLNLYNKYKKRKGFCLFFLFLFFFIKFIRQKSNFHRGETKCIILLL